MGERKDEEGSVEPPRATLILLSSFSLNLKPMVSRSCSRLAGATGTGRAYKVRRPRPARRGPRAAQSRTAAQGDLTSRVGPGHMGKALDQCATRTKPSTKRTPATEEGQREKDNG